MLADASGIPRSNAHLSTHAQGKKDDHDPEGSAGQYDTGQGQVRCIARKLPDGSETDQYHCRDNTRYGNNHHGRAPGKPGQKEYGQQGA
jgi:hypothetical protein